MKERGISEASIHRALEKPHSIEEQARKRFKAIKRIVRKKKRYALVVIYDQSERCREVVTAFISSKIDKYL